FSFESETRKTMSDTVLLVEDDDETRDLLARALRRTGLTVLTAASGEEGIEMIRRHRPPVTILDLILPDISGEVICAAVRADRRIANLYILILTGLASAEDRIAGFESWERTTTSRNPATFVRSCYESAMPCDASSRRSRKRKTPRSSSVRSASRTVTAASLSAGVSACCRRRSTPYCWP
ncbi:MAG: response regulator, partial [Vicinamibacteria bacterium]|nr:response regulator [Vicinamibacteria bacterium]